MRSTAIGPQREAAVAVDEPGGAQGRRERRLTGRAVVDPLELQRAEAAFLVRGDDRLDPDRVFLRRVREREQPASAALEVRGRGTVDDDDVGARGARGATGALGPGQRGAVGLRGSVAASTSARGASVGSRSERNRSTAPPSANCAAPNVATNQPRRIFPESSSARSTGYTAANPPATASDFTPSRVTTPWRSRSWSASACAASVAVGRGSSSGATSDHRPEAAGGPSRDSRPTCGRRAVAVLRRFARRGAQRAERVVGDLAGPDEIPERRAAPADRDCPRPRAGRARTTRRPG